MKRLARALPWAALRLAAVLLWPVGASDQGWLWSGQPYLEDPETLLAERDDLRAQLATKNSEFLAQHRRADQLVLRVRSLEGRLQAKDLEEQSLQSKLNRIREILQLGTSEVEAPSNASTSVATALRASRPDSTLSRRWRLAPNRSGALPQAAGRMPRELHRSRPAPGGTAVLVRGREADRPQVQRHIAERESASDGDKEGSSGFNDLETALREEDSRIDELDRELRDDGGPRSAAAAAGPAAAAGAGAAVGGGAAGGADSEVERPLGTDAVGTDAELEPAE